jgi:hypothetical protein
VKTVVWKRTEPHPFSRGCSRNRLALRLIWCNVRRFRNRAGAWFGEGATQDPKIIHTPAQPQYNLASPPRLTITSPPPPDTPALLFTRGLAPQLCYSDSHVIHAPAPRPPPHRRNCASRSFLDERTDIACDAHSPLTAGRSTGRYLIPSISIATRIALAASLRKSTRPSIAPQPSGRSLDNPKSTNIG